MTSSNMRPPLRPSNPCFASGPCAKRPGWSIDVLANALVGRSHRSAEATARFSDIFEITREVLCIPKDYKLLMVEGSNTGAMEMAMWSLLGERSVDALSYEPFGHTWAVDCLDHLPLGKKVQHIQAPFGELPDITKVKKENDLVFVWNGTPAGVYFPDLDWIQTPREGLVICDAISAVGALPTPWEKFDVLTFSWQKIFGSEAAHGMCVFSPRAYERLKTYRPPWPVPRIFRVHKLDGRFIEEAFEGSPINTPSLLVCEDYLDALLWAKSIGGTKGMQKRSSANFKSFSAWVEKSDRFEFLAKDPRTCSPISPTIRVNDPRLSEEQAAAVAPAIATLLANEKAAYDIKGYGETKAPSSLRVWLGPTVERDDVEILCSWIDWAYQEVLSSIIEK